MIERKVIDTTDTIQTRNQACCSRRNDMMRKINVSLARCRKLLREEGPGSTVKNLLDKDIADQDRNDVMGVSFQ